MYEVDMSAALVVRRPQAHSTPTSRAKGCRGLAPGSGLQRLDQGLIGTEALEACFHRAIKPLMGKNGETGNARDGCTGSGVVVLPENGGDPQVRLLLVGATAPPVVMCTPGAEERGYCNATITCRRILFGVI